MHEPNKRLKTIAFFLALNIFGVYVGALFNFHMHHIFHKALLPQDMVCGRNKQKSIYTATNNDFGNGSPYPIHDGLITINLADQLLPDASFTRLFLPLKEQPHPSYTGNILSLRAPPLI